MRGPRSCGVSGKGNQSRANQIRKQIEETTSDCDREKLQERLEGDEKSGAIIVRNAIEVALRILCRNAGLLAAGWFLRCGPASRSTD
jgi:chaperonin GroEL (HSP60 family)